MRYIIGITWGCLVDFKCWGKSVVAALESIKFVVIADSETRNLWKMSPWWDHSATVSLQGAVMSLHGAKVSLHDDLVSLHGAIVSLHGAIVSLHGAMVSLHGAMVSLHSVMVSLHGDLVSLHSDLVSLHSAMLSLHGAMLSICCTTMMILFYLQRRFRQNYRSCTGIRDDGI